MSTSTSDPVRNPQVVDAFEKEITQNRGKPRIFLESLPLVRAGFSPGSRYELKMGKDRLVLQSCEDGSRVVSRRKRRSDGEELAVIDINSARIKDIFGPIDRLRVLVKPGMVVFVPLASQQAMRERYDRIAKKVADQNALSMGSMFHGGGVLSAAIHEGLEVAGFAPQMRFANEIRQPMLEQSARKNPSLGVAPESAPMQTTTQLLNVPAQELVQDPYLLNQLPQVDVLEMGIPCSGASVAGRAKRHLSQPEDHPEVGHLAFAALVIISKVQPAVLLIENVPSYANTGSAGILRGQLRAMGYDLHEAELEGADFGTIENRKRWCMVAVTKGLQFSFDQITPELRNIKTLNDIIDPSIKEDDPRWVTMQGLKNHAEKHKAKGHGFSIQSYDADSTSVGTITKGYAKIRATDPKLNHPTDPSLMRQFTPQEHARIKGVPECLIEGLSDTHAHELLGQGIVYDPFVAVGARIGRTLMHLKEQVNSALHTQFKWLQLADILPPGPSRPQTVPEVVHQASTEGQAQETEVFQSDDIDRNNQASFGF